MSHAPVPLDDSILPAFKSATQTQTVRYFKLIVKDEKVLKDYQHSQSFSVQSDFNTMKDHVSENEAAYFLFRLEGNAKWLFLSYCPDSVGVKDKMTFASARGFVKSTLGENYFVEDNQVTTKEELDYNAYKGNRDVAPVQSKREIALEEVNKAEKEARSDFDDAIKRKTTAGASGIGGFHTVAVSLSEKAKTELSKLKDGTSTFLELVIAEGNEKVDPVGGAKNVFNAEGVSKEISGTNPRFYVYVTNKIQKQVALVYYCPDNSPQKLRMVYSTAKQGIADELTRYGLPVASRKLEISDPKDATEELNRNLSTHVTASNAAKKVVLPEGGGSVNTANNLKVGGNAPTNVYGLMNNKVNEGASTKKKIVIPPPAAYGF
eukprot:TRINITY_DN777_c0_g1_i1.p1 TRINITY_DN777_c0_g1~~TRINITY_DN777_c0_g1_i1.p1  ORF type:complete len:377 (-),score=166.59 TRINITY_DN777_c0_g1_i1:149-1279(-)